MHVFLRYWSSSVSTLQGARLWLLSPILLPSFKHELDFNIERQPLCSSELTVHAQAILTFLHCWEAWNYYPPLLYEVLRPRLQKHIKRLHLGLLEDKAHWLYCNRYILKTAVSGTTVSYALSTTEASSIMATSIPTLFPHRFLDFTWGDSSEKYQIPLINLCGCCRPTFKPALC